MLKLTFCLHGCRRINSVPWRCEEAVLLCCWSLPGSWPNRRKTTEAKTHVVLELYCHIVLCHSLMVIYCSHRSMLFSFYPNDFCSPFVCNVVFGQWLWWQWSWSVFRAETRGMEEGFKSWSAKISKPRQICTWGGHAEPLLCNECLCFCTFAGKGDAVALTGSGVNSFLARLSFWVVRVLTGRIFSSWVLVLAYQRAMI